MGLSTELPGCHHIIAAGCEGKWKQAGNRSAFYDLLYEAAHHRFCIKGETLSLDTQEKGNQAPPPGMKHIEEYDTTMAPLSRITVVCDL